MNFMADHVRALMKDCGDPVSKRATHPKADVAEPQCVLIRVVKVPSSIVITPPTKPGPCSESRG